MNRKARILGQKEKTPSDMFLCRQLLRCEHEYSLHVSRRSFIANGIEKKRGELQVTENFSHVNGFKSF